MTSRPTLGAIAKHQDGNNTGQITNMKVDASDNMFVTYSNGLSRVIGQVSLTTFDKKTHVLKGGNNDILP
jgi:flagellar hook protein FlgE